MAQSLATLDLDIGYYDENVECCVSMSKEPEEPVDQGSCNVENVGNNSETDDLYMSNDNDSPERNCGKRKISCLPVLRSVKSRKRKAGGSVGRPSKRTNEFNALELAVEPEVETGNLTAVKPSGSKMSILTPEPRKKSVLSVGGRVGEKLRENFCRLLNNDGPQFVTCRQCILQVNRARVFPDSRKEIPHLLSHIQLHEEINREEDASHVAKVDKNPKKKIAPKKSLSQKKKKKSENCSHCRTNSSTAISPANLEGTSLDISGVDASVSPTALAEVVPTSFAESADTIVVCGEEEHFPCSYCDVVSNSLEDFIAHSISSHNRSKFAVKFGDRELEKAAIENLGFDCAFHEDDDSRLSLMKSEDEKNNEQIQLDEAPQNPFSDLQVKYENATGSCAEMDSLGYVNDVPDNASRDDVIDTSAKPAVSSDGNKPKRGRKKKTPVDIVIGVKKRDMKRVQENENKEHVRGPFICIECGDGEDDCYNLREHMTRMHGDRSRVFVCKSCTTTWSEKNFHQFQKHMNLHHPGEEISCYFCRLTFKSCLDIRYHQAQHRPPLNFSCPYCYQEFPWILEAEFTNHVVKHQYEDLPFQCRDCLERFSDFVARREHQSAEGHDLDVRKFHDDLRPYICTGCGKQFVNTGKSTGVRALRQHVCQSGVTLDPRFECQFCKCQFPLGRSLRQHMREKHEHHMCHLCGTICRSKASLDEHVGSEHYGSQFPCPVCQETFDTSQKMKQHKTREHSARDFICEFCGQDFAARLLLVRHLKKHDEFQGFVCNVCGDKFLLADRLETHFRKYHAHVVSDQEYETIILDNVQTALATETIAIIQE